MDEFSKFIFGDQDTKSRLQSQITSLQETLSKMGPNDPQHQTLVNKLANLKGMLEQEMQKQGATDEFGRLVSSKDVQNQYINQDYLSLLKQQAAQTEGGAMAQGLKSAKQAQMQGTGGAGDIRSVMAKVENIARNNNMGLANAVYGEQNNAYNKATGDLTRKQNYATQLSDVERASIVDSLTQQLADANFTASQLSNLQNQLKNMPDGFLQQLASSGASMLPQLIKLAAMGA